ncbi:hypothetical protein K2173_007341 [Erythroxylum novogranatense]|uniref:SBP-type domain-containing protein n=1 Tax=Erythroxylum novogranatense TaxID=1862640 RepID=A0AAV8S5V5_9ROSI|nr:hypothetical protein K2173_007341 [Erythroxylum novogranatense]
MEEVGEQVAAPLYMSNRFCESGSMARKRDLACQISDTSFQYQQHHNPGLNNWNPQAWSWDSVKFVAKPLDPDVVLLGTTSSSQQQHNTKHDVHINHHFTSKHDEDEDALRLNLGGVLNAVEEPASRPNKRLCSGSPGTNSYPMCQVDDCKEDLSTAKDYHRRHKVCELHSKSSKALVGKQMQRFCQQCSRFHPLLEFDEGKRSCRRRLAGHNRRRRKTQPDDASSHLIHPGKQDTQGNGNLDLVKLLTAITRSQGKNEDKSVNYPTGPDRDQLMQILSKINALPFPMDLAEMLSNIGSLSRKIIDQSLSECQNRLHGSVSSSSATNLLNALSTTLPAPAPNSVAILPERSSQSSDSEKSKLTSSDQLTDLHQRKRPPLGFPSAVGERTSGCYRSPAEDSDFRTPEVRPALPLQLFSSSPENDSTVKQASSGKYFSSDSSNPIEERSPSASPPFVQKLFPLHSNAGTIKSEKTSIHGKASIDIEGTEPQVSALPLELFRGPTRGNGNDAFQSLPLRDGYASSSGSDHSPPSQSSEAQDRTGRIMFKLFDKDPSHFPGTLRMQIYNWLSSSPSEMESYIRPGCVFLSIYVAMSTSTWEHLDRNLLQQVDSLVQNSNSDLWRTGRFIMQIGRQLASQKDGRTRLCKAWSSWSSPELISISPLAVVSGQETTLLLRGKNLTNLGTNFFCTDIGGYTSLKVTASTYSEGIYDEISVGDFKIHGSSPNALGRCFVEVENGFKGTSFPVIIADDAISKELRLLEPELDEEAKACNDIAEEHAYDLGPPNSRNQILHFLNEIGWLFQRKRSFMSEIPNYSLDRFKFLLVFSVARDFCVLIKIILDMLVERNTDGSGLSRESLETLSDTQLLNRAIKRRCRKMVELLINYSVSSNEIFSRQYIFTPNLVGPGGTTPLHLAACTSGSEEMIDALTNDPREIGLTCWKTQLDANGHSPHDYAVMTQNHSYNKLVIQKLADRRRRQISVTITNEAEQIHNIASHAQQGWRSCEKCATVAAKYYRKIQGSQGLLQRPYIHSMLAIAAVCVCVCLFLRGAPDIGLVAPFEWEDLDYGTM